MPSGFLEDGNGSFEANRMRLKSQRLRSS